jgi:hypothetical protein
MSYENPFPRNRLKTRVFTSKTPNLRGLKETWANPQDVDMAIDCRCVSLCCLLTREAGEEHRAVFF